MRSNPKMPKVSRATEAAIYFCLLTVAGLCIWLAPEPPAEVGTAIEGAVCTAPTP